MRFISIHSPILTHPTHIFITMLKRFLPDLVVILGFIILSFAYFFPADIEGRILFQHDTAAGVGVGQEAAEYRERTGEYTRWTNSLFGGMPTYQIAPSYPSTEPLQGLQKLYRLFLPTYVNLTFILLLGFYILLRAFGISPWLAGVGGVAWAFSSYFFILISAGHIWKFVTLAYIPPTLAGIVLAYRGRVLAGGILTAIFIAFQMLSNHVQMSYYFLFVILFMIGAFFEQARREKQLPRFFKASAVLFAAAIIGVATNLSNLYHTYSYSKETMRGKNELTAATASASNKQAGDGLTKEYITHWSYGVDETLTLLVPNFKGGASVPLAANETAMKKANPMYTGLYSQLTQYFGTQPMTSGPVYVGAFVLFLFVLGCFIVKGPLKWALLGSTLFSIALSWGKNFMPLTELFIDYMPMYNKFRAVSSILVIAEFTIPLLAVFALKQLIETPRLLVEQKKPLLVSLALTAGVALLTALFPGFTGSEFIPAQEAQMLQRAVDGGMIPSEELNGILTNLQLVREELVTTDAWRSVIIIAIGVALLWLYAKGKLSGVVLTASIALLCVIDMWGINKRYLNDSQFVAASTRTDNFKLSAADTYILQDKSLNYRVLNFASDTFNENNTSYHHKSVGGYHPAKLQRYQDMIERHIAPEMRVAAQEVVAAEGRMDSVNAEKFRILNMLNTKYFIFPTAQGQTMPVLNPYAYGNAWFVEEVSYVADANEEMGALYTVSPLRTAVVDKRFKESLHGAEQAVKDSTSAIRLVSYEPNHLVYETANEHPGIAVFSEVYYPNGWYATIDGVPAEIARANYILRAIYIPAGKHTIEMRFDPQSLHITERIAYAALAFILLAVIVLVVRIRKRSTTENK